MCIHLNLLFSEENKTLFGQNGGTLVLADMLKEYINNARICEQICCTLSGIVMGNRKTNITLYISINNALLRLEQNKVDFAVVGGIKLLLDAMSTNSDSCPVAQWALSSLCAVTYISKTHTEYF